MRFAAAILILIAFASCSRKLTTTTSSVTDSTFVREVVRRDTINIPGDTVRIVDRIECDSITSKPKPFKSTVKSGRAKLIIEVKSSGVITAEASCDSLQKVIDVMDREIFRYRHEKKETTIIKQPSKFKIWIDYTAYFLAIIFILYIVFTVVKKIYL